MLNKSLNFQEKAFYIYKILVKIGFVYYWLLTTLASIFFYCLLKFWLIGYVCNLLDFYPVQQNYLSALIIFLGTFLFC